MTTAEITNRLLEGNKKFLLSKESVLDTNPELRNDLTHNGQHPYVAVLACSDSRVNPEAIFSAGLGEIFTIRIAGNVPLEGEIASIEYATAHLGVKYVLVLGHTRCGAVDAALHGHAGGYVGKIVHKVMDNIAGEKDASIAEKLNAEASAKEVESLLNDPSVSVIPAIYDIESGAVTFLK